MIAFDFKLSYFEDVEADIDQAKYWYYEQNPDSDLEERFAEAITLAIDKLQTNPYVYHPIFENMRVAHPRFFPYCIYFLLNESQKQITIVGIFHSKQDISNLLNRLY
jgi:plasmid stabilization system protein ParE